MNAALPLQNAILAIEAHARQDAAEKVALDRAARCPAAEAIIEANPEGAPRPGMPGALAMFAAWVTPGFYKRQSARHIKTLRRNRLACKQMGRNWRGADAHFLAAAAYCRREAARLVEIEAPAEFQQAAE